MKKGKCLQSGCFAGFSMPTNPSKGDYIDNCDFGIQQWDGNKWIDIDRNKF